MDDTTKKKQRRKRAGRAVAVPAQVAEDVDGAPGPELGKYRHHLDHLDLTETEKAELLLALYRIMQSFVDRAFGDDPVQQVHGPADKSNAIGAADSARMVDCRHQAHEQDLCGAFRAEAGDS